MAEDDWDGWKLLTETSAASPARRRRPLRHQSERAARRHRAGPRQLDPGQGQPDRHPDRDAGRRRYGPPRRLHGGDVPPLGRDRGFDHRRPRRRHQLRADQDRLAVALRPHWPSTTSSCASRRNWATQARLRRRARQGAAERATSRQADLTPRRLPRSTAAVQHAASMHVLTMLAIARVMRRPYDVVDLSPLDALCSRRCADRLLRLPCHQWRPRARGAAAHDRSPSR